MEGKIRGVLGGVSPLVHAPSGTGVVQCSDEGCGQTNLPSRSRRPENRGNGTNRRTRRDLGSGNGVSHRGVTGVSLENVAAVSPLSSR